jgi:GT2 family glycosyltransferase
MSVYNVAKYLREAVDAVLAQTFSQFELIIVDDGSVWMTVRWTARKRSWPATRMRVFGYCGMIETLVRQ